VKCRWQNNNFWKTDKKSGSNIIQSSGFLRQPFSNDGQAESWPTVSSSMGKLARGRKKYRFSAQVAFETLIRYLQKTKSPSIFFCSPPQSLAIKFSMTRFRQGSTIQKISEIFYIIKVSVHLITLTTALMLILSFTLTLCFICHGNSED